MGGSSRRLHLARTALVALLLGAATAALPAAAQARWSRPVQFAPPGSVDIRGPELAFSAAGLGAVGFDLQDQDNPPSSSPEVSFRSSSGTVSAPRPVPGSLELLSIAWQGRTLVLLTGGAPSGDTCCSTAGVMTASAGGRFARPRRLVHGLGGATVGALVSLGRRLLAAIGTERGVWIAQSGTHGRWGSTRALAGAHGGPAALAATAASDGGSDVAWLGGPSSDVGAHGLYVASGTATRPPKRGHAAIIARPGHGIDELAIAPGPGGATIAWIESWYDRRGNYHSEALATDLHHPKRTWAFPIAGNVASGLTLAGDDHGDQVLAWRACTWNAVCSTRAVLRSVGHGFGAPQSLGAIDATAAPVADVSSSGEGIVGWIDRGHVLARERGARDSRFSSTQTVSSTDYADNLTLSFGPANTALAAWSQGTLAPDVVGAIYRH